MTIFGDEEKELWKDHKGGNVNAIRTRTLIGEADVVVVRFGEKYRQWNAAFDAGWAAALGKPLVVLHPPEHTHALKEVDGAALAGGGGAGAGGGAAALRDPRRAVGPVTMGISYAPTS